VRACAELLDESNRLHLDRVNVDEVIVRGKSTGTLLAGTAMSPGLASVLEGILAFDAENRLWRMKIPERFVGVAVDEFRKNMNNVNRLVGEVFWSSSSSVNAKI